MNEIQEKIVELRQKQLEEQAEIEQNEVSYTMTELEILTLSNFSLQRENLELKLREIDRSMFVWNRQLYDRLGIDPTKFEIGFDDTKPNTILARRKGQVNK